MLLTSQLKYKVIAPNCCLLGEGLLSDYETRTIYREDVLNENIHENLTFSNSMNWAPDHKFFK